MEITVEAPDSFWTIATAVATSAAVIAALVGGWRDRRSAQRNLKAQLEASRRRAELEHEVDLLLKLQVQVGEYHYCHRVHDNEKRADTFLSYIRGLLYATRRERAIERTHGIPE